MNKKGLENALVGIVIVVLTLIALFFPYNAIYGSVNNDKADLECKLSVAKAVATKNALALNCPMIDVEVERDDAEGEEGLKIIAERMRKCWENFGEGNLKPFDKDVLGAGEIICQRCSKITFSPDTRVGQIEGLRTFLDQNKMRMSDEFYSDYLYGELPEFTSLVPDTIDTTDTYYVIYQTYNPDLIDMNELVEGTPLFLLARRKEVSSSVVLVNGDSIKDLECKYEYD